MYIYIQYIQGIQRAKCVISYIENECMSYCPIDNIVIQTYSGKCFIWRAGTV